MSLHLCQQRSLEFVMASPLFFVQLAQFLPVDVTFKSDDETWVQITNFRAPKKFQTETIKILPGNYEVVGRRRGYRDVVMLLQVRGGMPAPEVTVICTVKADK